MVVGDIAEEIEHPLLVGVRGLSRDDPDRDSVALRLLGYHDLSLPVEIEDRRVESVVVELEGVTLEEEVHLPGLERSIRRETQVFRHRERFLPAVAEVDAEKDKRHREDENGSEAIEDARRPVEDGGPPVCVGRLLLDIRDELPKAADFLGKRRIEDQFDV